jgi:hypothetical protein
MFGFVSLKLPANPDASEMYFAWSTLLIAKSTMNSTISRVIMSA